jgi:hypothetical protein
MPQGNRVASPIVLNNASVIDGQIGGLMFEISHGITARGHDFT